MRVKTPWIYSLRFDLLAIIGPPIAVTAIVLIWGNRLSQITDTPPWLWILLVLGIDVAHVYSSLFRTYFDKEEFRSRKALYVIAPIASWVGGVVIYGLLGPSFFWSVVAYFAIYHFVRQQYGFLMLYRRGEPPKGLEYRIDQVAIYGATVYPLIYWHTYPRNFEWFSDFKMLHIPVQWPEVVCRVIYVAALVAFTMKEVVRWRRSGSFNLGKSLLLYATAAAWLTGIVLFNGDLTFTLINIVSHGVPYMALIWIFQYRKRTTQARPVLRFFQLKYIPLYVLALFALAYFEEGIWDWFVWKEHGDIFGGFSFPSSAGLLMILVPLLTMPQVTHYVLDAFIWRVNKRKDVRAVMG